MVVECNLGSCKAVNIKHPPEQEGSTAKIRSRIFVLFDLCAALWGQRL